MVHLTEKPVELAVRALQYSSRPGENALDLFGGSGSTLIAAEQSDRRAFPRRPNASAPRCFGIEEYGWFRRSPISDGSRGTTILPQKRKHVSVKGMLRGDHVVTHLLIFAV